MTSEWSREPIPCMDHGFVRLVDVMGDDRAIVEAARLSVAGEGVRKVSEDRALIRYLMRHRHTTPFEMVELKFHAKMPIFVARQWVRHRTASLNEMSGRYSVLPTEFYTPAPEDVCYQDKKNRQGRAETVPEAVAGSVIEAMRLDAEQAFDHYREYLGERDHAGAADALTMDECVALKEGGGLARELARINLPLSTYTEWYWKIDLHNLFHFLGLRLDAHAQKEIRVYAEAMYQLIKPIVPLACEAFEDFRFHAVTFSRVEMRALRKLLMKHPDGVREHGTSPELISSVASAAEWPTKREREEFEAKLTMLLGGAE